MDTLHPSVKYGVVLAMLTAVTYGIFSPQVPPQEVAPSVLGTVTGLTIFGLIGRKLTKDPFVGFVGAILVVLIMWAIAQFAL